MNSLLNQTLHSRYTIQSLLGHQPGRRTFLAHDQSTGESVVLKLLLFGPDGSWDAYKLFEREASTLKSFAHPAIPRYLDYFEVDTDAGQGFALVQSYIEARSLQAWMDQGRTFSEEELKAIAVQLLEILGDLHEHQPPIIHRDIKPSNILLADDRTAHSVGTVYLIDFGSVQCVKQLGTLTVVGTYGYMPMEQFGGQTVFQSDLFSLGATLLYLMNRIHPADLPRKRGEIQFTSAMSSQWQRWLRYLLRAEVCDRPKSANQALDALADDAFLNQVTETSVSKPVGSRVTCLKHDDRLEIIIPPATLKQKLVALIIAGRTTLLLSLPAVMIVVPNFIANIIGLIAILTASKFILSAWHKFIFVCFFRFNFSVHTGQFQYDLRSSPFQIRSISGLTSDLTCIDKTERHYLWNVPYLINQLTIWAGVKSLSFPSVQVGKETVGLHIAEVNWLAFEISQVLDLPIHVQQLDVKDTSLPQNWQTHIPSEVTDQSRHSFSKRLMDKKSATFEVNASDKAQSSTFSRLGFFVMFWVLSVSMVGFNVTVFLAMLGSLVWAYLHRQKRQQEIQQFYRRQQHSELVRDPCHEKLVVSDNPKAREFNPTKN